MRALPIGLPQTSQSPYVPASSRASARSVCSSISWALAASDSSCSRVMFLVPVSASSSPAPSPESRISPARAAPEASSSRRSRRISLLSRVRASVTSSGVQGSSPGRTASSSGATARAGGTGAVACAPAAGRLALFLATTVGAPVCSAARAASVAAGAAVFAVLSAVLFLAAGLSPAAAFLAAVFLGAVFFTVFFAAFFATMAAALSHVVILLANRAGTINRLQSRGNGARRPLTSPVSGRGAPASVVPSSPPGNPSPGPRREVLVPRPATRVTPARLDKPVGRRPYGPVHWPQREASTGRVAPYAASSDPGTVGARGRARCEDHP